MKLNSTLALFSYAIFAPTAVAIPRPNIVVIVIDDLGYADMSCMETASKDVKTPAIDALASRGTLFPQSYATAPICNASRIGLITGAYQQRQGVYWYGGKGLSNNHYESIAESLKKSGYKTGYIGKFHHGTTDNIDGRGFPLNHGFDTFFGFSGGTKHYLIHDAKYKESLINKGPLWNQKEKVTIEGFTTEIFGQKAREFIQKHKDENFYLQLSFNGVHNFTHQLPDAYLKEKGLKKFPDFNPKKEKLETWRKKISYPACPEGRDYYLGQLHFLDIEIGRITAEIKKLGLEQNTVILLISDNGGSLVTYANNSPLKGGKYTLFEGGIRTPMIISYPSVLPENKRNQSIVSAMDILPTICDLTKTTIPQHVDGKSLLTHLKTSQAPQAARTLFWQTNKEKAVRKGKWKLLVTSGSPNPKLQITPTLKGSFLYDLEADMGEKINLAEKHPQIVSELLKAHSQWSKSIRTSK